MAVRRALRTHGRKRYISTRKDSNYYYNLQYLSDALFKMLYIPENITIFVPVAIVFHPHSMREEELHYLWEHRMLGRRQLQLTDGSRLAVLDPGCHNLDAGPDFFNARMRLGTEIWAGDVEIHLRASDWYRHGHHNDAAYQSVVLHVVGDNDSGVTRPDGHVIPQMVIDIPEGFHELYQAFNASAPDIRCARYIPGLPSLTVTDWLETLFMERLQRKASAVNDILRLTNADWESTCFITLARALGFGLNSDPFEMTARSIPLNVLRHHSNSLLQLEAIIFGQAGLIPDSLDETDDYCRLMKREYSFLSKKYRLVSPNPNWKFARTRPQNFPHRRLALLAHFCRGGFSMMRKWIENTDDPDFYDSIFDIPLEGYWNNHYNFGKESPSRLENLTRSSRRLLIINAVVPVLYAYACRRSDDELIGRVTAILSRLPAESNSIVREWRSVGITIDTAIRSQAVLQLKREYCALHKCSICRFGHKMTSQCFQ